MSEQPPRGETRSRSTRERLLLAAVEMFSERGYAATGVQALCRRAGVAKTGLYWEFQSKAGLLAAVIDHVVEAWVDQVAAAARRGDHPRERLDLALGALRATVVERPELFRLLLVVAAERAQVDGEARDALRRFYDRARAALAAGVREAAPGFDLPDAELDAACDALLAMLEGIFLRMQVDGDRDFDRTFAAARAAIILVFRELVANVQGLSTLVGRVSEIARPLDREPG